MNASLIVKKLMILIALGCQPWVNLKPQTDHEYLVSHMNTDIDCRTYYPDLGSEADCYEAKMRQLRAEDNKNTKCLNAEQALSDAIYGKEKKK